jgi:hypothetical protein
MSKMPRSIKIAVRVLLFIILTILTQVGGVIYLINRLTYKAVDKRIKSTWFRRSIKFTAFVFLYCATSFVIVPFLAKPFGRVPLPMETSSNLRPATIFTCIMNRNYVKPELRDMVYRVVSKMNAKYPGTAINFLDANFPFFNKFPLLPHWSHNDGKKLDLSFCYNDSRTSHQTNAIPTLIGYGICEEPVKGEIDKPCECSENGFWQYNMLRVLVPQTNKINFVFNGQKTKDLVEMFAAEDGTGKIFLEPHLVKRLNLNDSKIRFHGCHAVRHDDHIHIQMK